MNFFGLIKVSSLQNLLSSDILSLLGKTGGGVAYVSIPIEFISCYISTFIQCFFFQLLVLLTAQPSQGQVSLLCL